MIIPSIDISNGQAVQLVGGERLAIEAGDPFAWAERFGLVGELAVIDLDAARGTGSNEAVIRQLCTRHRCRVGGGIRSLEQARAWLDAGAQRIILGTAAHIELLSQLPSERVIAALDAVHGEVVVEGWKRKTGASIEQRMHELRGHVGGFLITFVDHEGRMEGTDTDRVHALIDHRGDARITFAGGITTAREIAEIDRLGADAQVGMALYSGRLSLAEAFAAPLRTDRPDRLWPTVVVDPHERALGLCYSNLESLEKALESRAGVYWSRSRGLWEKGTTSGARQRLLRVDLDCDRDTLRFVVEQSEPGFCHLGTQGCWGDLGGLPTLVRRLTARLREAPEGSYTRRLLDDPDLLRRKLLEESRELGGANGREEVCWETADLLYFTLVRMVSEGVSLTEVERELDRRARAVTRRGGDAKPDPREPS
jgi:phosphoribosyl-ATP pyrophosphohydrolase